MARKCKTCGEEGHNSVNKKFHPIEATETNTIVEPDNYTQEILRQRYTLHKNYVKQSKELATEHSVSFRLPSIPEDISENIVKFIIHKCGDITSKWNCKGDLLSEKEGKQECKCFTSDGPPSFTPSSEWDVIYFLDARKWLDDVFVLFKVSLKRTSEEWKKIQVSKKQTFNDQCQQGRRPRITWESLFPQIETHCEKIYEGTFDDVFTPQGTGPADSL